ncbi:MAG: subclass B3 metallo-beta-lactamase [Acidobacteriaceae bacterium]|nr:subclass B3 metallo-beta-lactamase [Acidobacteriaceae bacterium]
MLIRAFLLAVTGAAFLIADFTPSWNQPVQPFKIISNLYYVGTNYLASFLITTPAGNILINPDYQESVPVIKSSVEKLGFRFTDTEIILISHAHDDHAAGCALAKKLTGAKLAVMAQDAPEIESGGAGDFIYKSRWQPAHVDRTLHDGDKVNLGGITLIAHLTPGHTKGCTTWTATMNDGGRSYDVVIVGSPNVNTGYKLVGNKLYPGIASDYKRTFQVLEGLHCDIFLGAHGVYFDMDEKLKRLKAGDPNPFVDPAGYRAAVEKWHSAFLEKLAEQESGK